MLMANDEMQTTAPDTGLRIRTEVKARAPAPPAEPAGVEIVCRGVNLSYGDNHVLHDITIPYIELLPCFFHLTLPYPQHMLRLFASQSFF